MKNIKYVVIFLLVILSVLLYNLKIHYNEENIYQIENFDVSDEIHVEKGYISLGGNILGFRRAIIHIDDKLSNIEYIFISFNEKWFNENIKSKLNKNIISNKLLIKSKEIHKDNIKKHISIEDLNDKVLFIIKYKNKEELQIIK